MTSAKLFFSILIVIALIIVNAVFVAAEFAIVRVRRTRLEELSGEGRAEARNAIELVDRVGEYLTTTQVGITAASLAIGWLGEPALAHLLGYLVPGDVASGGLLYGVASTLAFILVTAALVIFGEIVPKNLAVANADRYLLRLAAPLRVFHRVMEPATRLFTALASGIQRGLGYRGGPPQPLSEAELKLVLEDSHEEGVLTRGEAGIIQRAFEFADQCAEEIMVPAEQVDFLSLTRPFSENLAVARKHMHARLPLCEGDIHSVRGIVSMKYVWPSSTDDNSVFERACRPATTVAQDASREIVLDHMRANRSQIAIVRDVTNARTLGIVSLEDVLDSLVGDVREGPIAPT